MNTAPVVTLGEALMIFNSPLHAPIERGSSVGATFGGAESNVAIGLARLGHAVRYLSVLGDDVFGRIIARTLRGEGVDVSCTHISSQGPTAVLVKNRRVYAEPEVLYYRAGSAFSHAGPQTFDPSCWRDARVLHLTGITPALSQSCLELVRHVLQDAHQHGIKVWFDPNFRRKLWSEEQARQTLRALLPFVDVILAGLDEARLLADEGEVGDIARALLDLGPSQVVLKAGERGAYFFSPRHDEFAPAFALRQLIDPIGAGDAFVAGFLSATLDGLPPGEALQRGNALGALVCQIDGDWEGLPRRAELERFLSRNVESER